MSGSTPREPLDGAAKPAWWLWLLIGGALVVVTLIVVLVALQLPSGGQAGPGAQPTDGPSSTTSPSDDPASPVIK